MHRAEGLDRAVAQARDNAGARIALADLLVVMNRGRIEDMGPPERVYARPASLFTAEFMGEVTRLPVMVTRPASRKRAPR